MTSESNIFVAAMNNNVAELRKYKEKNCNLNIKYNSKVHHVVAGLSSSSGEGEDSYAYKDHYARHGRGSLSLLSGISGLTSIASGVGLATWGGPGAMAAGGALVSTTLGPLLFPLFIGGGVVYGAFSLINQCVSKSFNMEGWTLLHFAAFSGSIDAADFLFDYVDITATDTQKQRYIDIADSIGHTAFVNFFKRIENERGRSRQRENDLRVEINNLTNEVAKAINEKSQNLSQVKNLKDEYLDKLKKLKESYEHKIKQNKDVEYYKRQVDELKSIVDNLIEDLDESDKIEIQKEVSKILESRPAVSAASASSSGASNSSIFSASGSNSNQADPDKIEEEKEGKRVRFSP